MTVKIRWYALPLVVLPLYSISSSLEACSSGPSGGAAAGTTQSNLVCASDEVAKTLSSGEACCRTGSDGRSTCRKPGEDAPGDACTIVGSTKPGSATSASFDVCVEEECSGDRRCTEFPLVVEETRGTLTCVQKSGGPQWELGATTDVHRVQRACLTARTEVCRGPGYSSNNPSTYGYSSAYFYGYGETCGYGGYGYGPTSINVRKLYLLGSTCSAAGAPATDCPLNGL